MSKKYKTNNNKYKTDTSLEYMKCAPAKSFTEGSCFSFESLVKMANEFNKYIKEIKGGSNIKNSKMVLNPISIKNDKRHIVKELLNRLEPICGDDQICWLHQDFIKRLHDKEINKLTILPLGPTGKFDWLSTTHIDDVMEQYMVKYNDFTFIGAVPMDFDELPFLGISTLNFDELYENGKTKIGIIFNTDEHHKSGTHWIALFADIKNSKIYYFDSYGIQPDDRVRNLVERIATWCNKTHKRSQVPQEKCKMMTKNGGSCKYERIMNIDFNRNRHQYKDSECGVYSLFFILKMLEGNKFEDIVSDKIPDQQMTDLRDKLFRFK